MKLSDILNEMSIPEVQKVERTLEKMFSQYLGIRYSSKQHAFWHRLIDPELVPDKYKNTKDLGREAHLNPDDIISIFARLIPQKKGKMMGKKQFGQDTEFVVIDKEKNINIVFKIDFSKTPPEGAIVTVIQKKGFKPNNPYDTIFYV